MFPVDSELPSQRVLRIPELVADICHSFGAASPKTILNIALVSRVFLSPSLDLLWRNVDILDLYKTLPSFKNIGGQWTLTTEPTVAEWNRFREYARRVRYITHSSGHLIPSSLLESMAAQFSDAEVMLPKLESLHSTFYGQGHIPNPFAELLFMRSKHLLQLRLANQSQKNQEGSDVLAHLITPGCKIEHIDLAGFPLSIGAIPSLIKLYHLSIDSLHLDSVIIGWSHLQELSKLPLTTLSITSCLGLEISPFELPPAITWPQLGRLSLTGAMPDVFALLSASHAPNAYQLDVSISTGGWSLNSSMVEQWRRCIQALADGFPKLLSLDLQGNLFNSSTASVVSVITLIQPLLSNYSIESLRMSGFPRLAMGDDDVERIAKAWANIAVLELPRFTSEMSKYPTLASLECLATLCPHLKSLGLAVNVNCEEEGSATFAHQLSLWDLSGSTISQGCHQSVSDAVNKMFPHVKGVIARYESTKSEGYESAQLIDSLVKSVQISC